MILVLLVLATTARADEATCKHILKDCNTALNAEIKENQLQKQIIQDQAAQLKLRDSHIQDIESHDSAFYRQPWFLITAGVLAGGYLVSQVRK